jgi:hypothetical protein
MNRCLHTNSLLAGGAACNLWLVAAVLQSPASASAQEALRNAVAAQAAAETPKINLETMPYTLKSGDFRLLVTPSLEMDWNDNINLSSSNPQQDFILDPTVQLAASYPITQVNLLRLDVGVGYNEYLEHDQYSNWQVTSGSQLSFDTYIKEFLINLHDRFSYSEDAAAQAVVAGTGAYGSANNVAGVSGTWNPNGVNMSLAYDHENILSLTKQFQSGDRASELIDGRVGWKFLPTATAGVEATYSSTAYDQAVLNNNSSYTLGAYGEWHPGTYFSVTPRAGYTIYQFQQTSESSEIFEFTPTGAPTVVLTGKPLQTSDFDSWYADVTLSHDITKAMRYSLSVGHEIQEGVESDAIEDSYLRFSATWKILKNLGLQGGFSYEHGQEGVGNVAGNLTEVYDWYTGSLGLTQQLTSRLRVGLNSRYTIRSSSNASLGYTQALVGLQLAYAFE